MSIVPTWPIAAGALVIGLAGGFYFEHVRLGAKIDRITTAHAEELRQREVQRAADERKARDIENRWAARAGEIEQRKTDEIAQVRSDADALIDRLRKQAASKPARPSQVPGAAPACPTAARPDVPERGGEDFVRLAERADTIRAGLAACYRWADEVMATPQAAEASPSQ